WTGRSTRRAAASRACSGRRTWGTGRRGAPRGGSASASRARCAATRSSAASAATRGSARSCRTTRASRTSRGRPTPRRRAAPPDARPAGRGRPRTRGRPGGSGARESVSVVRGRGVKMGPMTSEPTTRTDAPAPTPVPAGATTPADLDPANPFAAPSALPYELPDYDAIREEHYLPALRAATAAQRAAVEAIATDDAPPTEDNVLAALERSGRDLARVLNAFYNQLSADATPGLEQIEEEFAPELAAHHDAIYMDARLYGRARTLQDAVDAGEQTLEPDAAWLLHTLLVRFRRSGVELDAAQQERLRELNGRLTTLEAAFGRALLAGANAASVLVTDRAELEGLPEDAVAGAAAAAAARGHEGAWLLEMQLPTQQGVLAALARRDVRERVQQASESRGATGDDHDTREIVLETVRLRAER